MIPYLNNASAQVTAPPLTSPVAQQQPSNMPRLRSRSSPQPALLQAKRALYEPRALAYVQLRAAEGRDLLPALKACFNGEPVLPVHLSDPDTERLGVQVLHIYAMGADDVRQVAIPWK